MLVGTANVAELAQTAPTIPAFVSASVTCEHVLCFQLTAEMHNHAREAVLPPSLHPTIPPCLSLQVWRVGASPWGAFAMAIARVTCRSGVRARGFTTAAFASTPTARDGLSATFGYPVRCAEVELRHGYDGISARVCEGERTALDVRAIDPEPMSPEDVQYTSTMNLAHTPKGLRLVQVEAEHALTRAERLTAKLLAFDRDAWGNALLDPYRVVSASLGLGQVVFPPLRFVCKPDELAFTGTEAVAARHGAGD